jgi:SAM-dependent methyltransferase
VASESPPRVTGRQPLIQSPEIREVIEHALNFQEVLRHTKAGLPLPDPGWYPWDSFGTVTLLDGLLTGRYRFVAPLAGNDPVLDIGCGDGALAFLFESLGCKVCAVDHPQSNYNRMRGVRALKGALRSRARIVELDIDRDFDLPVRRCGLALLLGVLYHLKNPYGVLEALAGRARYCLLSTAITPCAPDGKSEMSGVAAAFLAGRDGLRGDETNYWVFTETGLRTLIDRTGWEVCDWLAVRDGDSILWNTQTDERVICLLRSRSFAHEPCTQLADGWHALESRAWRWTERRFSMAVEPGMRAVTLKVTVPESLSTPLMLRAGDTTHVFSRPGDYECLVPLRVSSAEQVVECEVDHALEPDERDNRQRGIIVRSAEVI